MRKTEEEKAEQKLNTIERSMGKPNFIQLSQETINIRRNLLFFSSICFAVAISNISVQGNGTFFGIQLTYSNPKGPLIFLFFATLYHLIHFTWQSWDTVLEWKIRLTGPENRNFSLGFGDIYEQMDIPEDPRNASIYNWWLYFSPRLKSIEAKIEAFRKLQDFGRDADAASTINNLRSELLNFRNILENKRLEASLLRFDKNFRLFQLSQLLRWATIEFTFPVVFSLIALFVLGKHIIQLMNQTA